MKVVKELTHGILLNHFAIRDKNHLVVSLLTFFDLDAPEAPLSEQEMWRFVPRELGDNAVLDAAMPKPRAEVLLRAKCFSPQGQPRPAAQVAFQVGRIAKTLNVFGPRFWERRAAGLAITDPKPFGVIDLDWRNAFGGPEFESNPLGRGMAPARTEAGTPALELPAVEDPAHLIGAPGDRPAPAGFMPLDQTWPQRRKKAGTYDQKWFREHWPYFPEDMNWTFFNTAPEDQQQDAFFQGGEAVVLTHMHSERQQVHSSLPRLRQRVFARQLKDLKDPRDGLLFREAQTRLDTVWLFPHALRGILVHRAVLEVADEEAVDIQHLYLVTESPDEAPQPLEHYLAALNKRLDRGVPIDMPQMDAAKAQAAEAMRQVADIPKALAHRLAVAQRKAPDAGISPQNAAAQSLDLLNQSQTRLDQAERQLGALRAKFGHLVKIDLAPLPGARAKLENLKATVARQMERAEALTQKALAAKSDMQDKVLASLDRPETRQFIPQVQAQMAPPAKAPWPEQALALVRQGRYDLSLDHDRMAALRRSGLRPATLKRALLASMPQAWDFDPQAWGLDPAPPTTMPAGLLLAAHQGATITRLTVRPGALEEPAHDITVPGSADTTFAAGLAPGKPVVRVADPLETWLVEQDAGDYVGAVALPSPDTAPDKETAVLIKEAPRLLIVLYAKDPAAREKEFAPWRAAYPQAEPLPLPELPALFDAHEKGVSIEAWIVTALGPGQAPFAPEESPFRAKKGDAAAGIAIPRVDAKGLYQAFHDGMMEKMAPSLARSEVLKQELPLKMNAAIDQAKAQLRRQGIDPTPHFNLPPTPPKPEGFLGGLDLAAKYDHVRQALNKAGQMTPERAAALDAQEAKMSGLVEASKARWAEGQAKRAGAGGGFAFPQWAKEMLAPLHIDPDDREEMTRETVIDRHARQVSLKGKELSGLDLSGLDLRGADLRGARMKKTSFAGSNLDGADLSATMAEEADFTGASFRNGKASQALMGKAVFTKAVLSDTDFTKALLKAADLSSADLSRCTLRQTLLEGANLSCANLAGARASQGYFMGADLSGANFTQAEAAKAVFHKTTAVGVDFSGSDLSKAIIWDSPADRAAFRGCNLHNVRIGGATSIQKGDFADANLERASLMDADLSDGNFKGSRFQRSFLRNCNLSRADLSGVQAKRTFFHRTNLEGANLSGANLFMGSLRKARLVDADLSKANLFGAETYRAVVGHTDFDQANLKMTLLNKRVELLDDPK